MKLIFYSLLSVNVGASILKSFYNKNIITTKIVLLNKWTRFQYNDGLEST